MNPPSLSSIACLTIEYSILQASTFKWTRVWQTGRNLPFCENCARFASELEEVLHFLENSEIAPSSVVRSLFVFNTLKQMARSLSTPNEWGSYTQDAEPRTAVWYSDPNKFASLFGIFSSFNCIMATPPLHPFCFWYPPSSCASLTVNNDSHDSGSWRSGRGGS